MVAIPRLSAAKITRALLILYNHAFPIIRLAWRGASGSNVALDQKIYELRKDKLRQIEALGQSAYPYRYQATHTLPQIVEQFAVKTGEELESSRVDVSV